MGRSRRGLAESTQRVGPAACIVNTESSLELRVQIVMVPPGAVKTYSKIRVRSSCGRSRSGIVGMRLLKIKMGLRVEIDM